MEAAEVLSRAFLEIRPDDAARVLERFSAEETAEVLADCTPEHAAQVVRRMVHTRAAECLEVMPAERAAAISGALAIEAAAPILRPLESGLRQAILENMPADTARALDVILRHAEGTAGALMDSRAFALPDDVNVGEAMERVRAAGPRVKYYLFVVDRDRRLAGIPNIRDFLLAEPQTPLSSLMTPDVVRLRAETPVAAIAADAKLRRYLFLPVVDDREVFLGVLELRTLRRERAPERRALETLLAMGELYWLGMSGLVGGLLVRDPGTPDRSSGESDGR